MIARSPFKCCPEGNTEFWHSFCPRAGWCCIVLDPYDVSIYRKGRGPQPAPFSYDFDEAALAELCQRNVNVAAFVKEHPRENVLCDYFKDIPFGLESRWVPFNGGVGSRQLDWLRDELESAASQEESVAVLSHVPVHPETAYECKTLLWNFEEVLSTLQSHAGRTVQMVVSGHQHQGGFHTDELGIHYIVMESPLLTGPHMPGSFLIIEAGESYLYLEGYGNSYSPVFPGVSEGSLGHRRLPLRRSAAAVADLRLATTP